MTVKRKAGRPSKKKAIKKTMPIEQKAEMSKQEKFVDLYPDRTPIYGGEEYVESDPTKLTKNGKDWDPRKAGYEIRLMESSVIKNMGFRGYEPVLKKSGIRFKNHPLAVQGFDGDAGDAVYLHPKDNEYNNDELEILSGGRSKYVKLNNMVLCIIPKEKADDRRKLATNIANSSLRKDLQKADEQAQEELGNSKTHGKFTLGETASRSWNEMDAKDKTKSVRKVWSVPAQIK